MRALVLGSGAREHSLAWKICQSPLLEKLYLYGANDGFSHLGQVFEAKNFEELVKISKAEKISIVIVGPEVLLTLYLWLGTINILILRYLIFLLS